LGLAFSVSFIAMLLGWMSAVMLWRWRGRENVALVWLVLPLAALPPYVHALVWLNVTSSVENLLRRVGWSLDLLSGWGGSVWVGVAAYSPLVLGFAWLGLGSVAPELIEAGRLARPDFRVLLRIVLPLSLPATLTGGGIVFLLSLLDYSVPSLLQVNVYALEIFAEYSASNSAERALLLGLPLLVLATGIVAALLEPLRALTLRQVFHRPVFANPPRWPVWFLGLGWALGALLIAQALLPLITLLSLGGDLWHLVLTITQARAEIGYSLWTATLAALFSLPLAYALARLLLQGNSQGKLLWLIVVTPAVVPASLVGIGFIYLFNHSLLSGRSLLENMMPALAAVTRFLPFGILIILAQLRRTDARLDDAARVFLPSGWRRGVLITVPLLAPGLLAATGLIFTLSIGELGATLMVVPPGQATLTMRIYNYMHYGASDAIAGLSLVIAVSVLLAGGVVAVVAALWSRLLRTPGGIT
jgi:iron(III) transport system permease protein